MNTRTREKVKESRMANGMFREFYKAFRTTSCGPAMTSVIQLDGFFVYAEKDCMNGLHSVKYYKDVGFLEKYLYIFQLKNLYLFVIQLNK